MSEMRFTGQPYGCKITVHEVSAPAAMHMQID
jgi:hypothetical protein